MNLHLKYDFSSNSARFRTVLLISFAHTESLTLFYSILFDFNFVLRNGTGLKQQERRYNDGHHRLLLSFAFINTDGHWTYQNTTNMWSS